MKSFGLLVSLLLCSIFCLRQVFAQTTYSDDFNDGKADGWITIHTNISNGVFVSSPSELAVWKLPGEITGDFVFEADARIVQRYNDPGGSDHVSLDVHVPFDCDSGKLSSNRWYGFTLRQGTLNDIYLIDRETGNLDPRIGYTLTPLQDWHRYKVTKTGNTYSYYIDGVLKFTRTFPSPYTGGYFVIYGSQGYTGSGTAPRIEWDNVSVITASGTFSENFDDGKADGWITIHTNISNGVFVSSPSELAVWKLPGMITDDFVFEIDARIAEFPVLFFLITHRKLGRGKRVSHD